MKIIAAFILLFAAFSAQAKLAVVPYISCADPEKIFFYVKNTGNEAVHIYEDQLPSMPSTAITKFQFFAISDGIVNKLSDSSSIYDVFARKEMTLLPKQSSTKSRSFGNLIDGFEKAHSSSDIFIVVSVSGEKFVTSKHLVFLPKKRLFDTDCPSVVVL